MLDYSDLRDIQRKEMESSAVVSLPDDFYQLISQLLEKKKGDAFSSQSLIAIKEYENLKKIVASIASKREEKIVLLAVGGSRDGLGLTTEEKELLKGLTSIIKNSRENVKNIWETKEESNDVSQRVKILKNVDKYRGLDNTIYGPFEQGEEQDLPKPEADWLLKSGMAELL